MRVSVKNPPPKAPPSRGPDEPIPAYVRLLLSSPEAIQKNLCLLYQNGHIDDVPSLWQIVQGTGFYWHRYFFRASTVGLSKTDKVKPTLRARLLSSKVIRTPFLYFSKAIGEKPDVTGLGVSPDYKIRHLLGAYHPGDNAVYDLQFLDCFPGKLEALRHELLTLLRVDNDQSRWLKDLVIYEGYHERLLAMVEENLTGSFTVAEENANNPDTSMRAYVQWCLDQPETPMDFFGVPLQPREG